MNSLEISRRFPFTEEELESLDALKKMTYDDIDFSDIPPISKAELKKFKPARLREQKLNLAS